MDITDLFSFKKVFNFDEGPVYAWYYAFSLIRLQVDDKCKQGKRLLLWQVVLA